MIVFWSMTMTLGHSCGWDVYSSHARRDSEGTQLPKNKKKHLYTLS